MASLNDTSISTGARPKTTKKQTAASICETDPSQSASFRDSNEAITAEGGSFVISAKRRQRATVNGKVSEMCEICANSFSIQKRKPIICEICQYTTCADCIKTFTNTCLGSGHVVPSCMNCKEEWSFEFFAQNVPTTLVWRVYQAKLFEEQQPALKTTLQNLKYKAEKKKHDDSINALNMVIARATHDAYSLKVILFKKAWEDIKQPSDAEILKNLKPVVEALCAFKKSILDASQQRYEIEKNNSLDKNIAATTVSCANQLPGGIMCRGQITSSTIPCCLCKTLTCVDCRVQINNKDTHSCDKNVLENLKYLEAESKQCPICSISISKINGCDNMWCTNCKKGFSWKTLKPINTAFHNPEREKWLNENKKKDHVEIHNWEAITNDMVNDLFKTEYWISMFGNNNNIKNKIEIKVIEVMGIPYIFQLPRMIKRISPERVESQREMFLENKISQDLFTQQLVRDFMYEKYSAKLIELTRSAKKKLGEYMDNKIGELCKNGHYEQVCRDLDDIIKQASDDLQPTINLYSTCMKTPAKVRACKPGPGKSASTTTSQSPTTLT